LQHAGAPANGTYNIDVSLWDALSGGTKVGGTQVYNGIAITDGMFAIDIDFGPSAFNGNPRWLEIRVNALALSPRQPITRTPYAIQTRGITVSDQSKVGIGTTTPQSRLHVSDNSDTNHTISGINTQTHGTKAGVYGQSDSTSGSGVSGYASQTHGFSYGVYGETNSVTGAGVFGRAAQGVGGSYGVVGAVNSQSGTGVYGIASSSLGSTRAIQGDCTSPTGFAGFFNGRGFFSKSVGFGTTNPSYPVHALNNSTNGIAIYGEGTWGVQGTSTQPEGRGVFGFDARLSGESFGIYGLTASSSGTGVHGYAPSSDGETFGVTGVTDSIDGYGVYGHATATDGTNHGVFGRSDSRFGKGVVALNTHPDSGIGLYAEGQQTAIYAECRATTGYVSTIASWNYSPDGYSFWAYGDGGDYGSTSSRRWKRNIVNIDDPLGKLSQIRGVYYDWDEEHGGGHDVGMIAEEVGAVMPEIVSFEENGIDAIGMDYSRTTPLLVEAVNALRAEKDAEITELRGRIDALEKLIAVQSAAGIAAAKNEDGTP